MRVSSLFPGLYGETPPLRLQSFPPLPCEIRGSKSSKHLTPGLKKKGVVDSQGLHTLHRPLILHLTELGPVLGYVL